MIQQTGRILILFKDLKLSSFFYDLAPSVVWFPHLQRFSWRGPYCRIVHV